MPKFPFPARLALVAVLALVASVPAAAQDKTFDVAEVEKKPSLKSPQMAAKAIEGSYPDALRSRRIGGQVMLEFVVMPDGKVDDTSVKVVAATVGALGDAAKDAIRRIAFNPGQVGDTPVRTLVRLPIEYRPDE